MTQANTQVDDPHLWLEDVTGQAAMDWVAERNEQCNAELAVGRRFERLRDEVRAVLDAEDRIPSVRRRGEYLYNFWQDAQHPRGLWRRTTLAEYRTDQPDWDVLLDIDALGASEDENWVWKGATVLRPDYRHCLVELSRGGADATVVREFDLATREFVTDGFTLPEAKSQVGWIDLDTIYVATDFGPGSLTTSGYPRIVKEWRRDTALADAAMVFEGKPEDIAVSAAHDPTEGFERDLLHRSIDFYTGETYLRRGADLVRIDVPDDAEIDMEREWLLVSPRTPWQVGDTTYPAGALVAARFEDYLAGARDLTVLFEPDEHTSLRQHTWTRQHLLLNTLSDVRSKLYVLDPKQGWRREPLAGAPEFGQTDIVDTDPDRDEEYLLQSSGYTEPATLRRGEVGGDVEVLKQEPQYFDTSTLSVRQFFATSDDGTAIPYFVVGPENATNSPTLLYGYGGFEVSLTPGYNARVGVAWLARGGTYVVANIRGGSEYGPKWHQAVLKANRHKVYEDFSSVARDLVARGITTPAQLGVQGGSNGGLLAGVMLTRYPELFGAVVSQVPLLDMKRYHLLLAGASWMAEYGDPREEDEWAYISRYSPYHNVHSGRKYPPVLFSTTTRDDRVHPGHARKMVARMLEQQHDVRYYEGIEGGHGAGADNEQAAHLYALTYEFLWRTLTDRE